jgi:enoyl-[acyl-carrier protein] reductase/trans-2-enoyl-CoA reductase (NAD+)
MKAPRVIGGVCLSVNPKGCMVSVRQWVAAEKGQLPLASGRIRVDDWDLRPDVQAAVAAILSRVNQDNLAELTDTAGCRSDLMSLYGF